MIILQIPLCVGRKAIVGYYNSIIVKWNFQSCTCVASKYEELCDMCKLDGHVFLAAQQCSG